MLDLMVSRDINQEQNFILRATTSRKAPDRNTSGFQADLKPHPWSELKMWTSQFLSCQSPLAACRHAFCTNLERHCSASGMFVLTQVTLGSNRGGQCGVRRVSCLRKKEQVQASVGKQAQKRADNEPQFSFCKLMCNVQFFSASPFSSDHWLVERKLLFFFITMMRPLKHAPNKRMLLASSNLLQTSPRA